MKSLLCLKQVVVFLGGDAASVLLDHVIDRMEFGNIVREFSSGRCQTHTKSCIEKGRFNRKVLETSKTSLLMACYFFLSKIVTRLNI